MVKHFKHSRTATLAPVDLETRVRRALAEGRTQSALELAKQLAKAEPGPARQDLLREVYLARAQQLRAQGQTRDAGAVLAAAAALPGNSGPAGWLENVAEELAACGLAAEAIRLLGNATESPAGARMLARAVDTALVRGSQGRQLLPEALRPHFDLILKAYALAETGRDEEARAALQEIGLQSPFLEWKLLLRGLLAYYQHDDPRALENWQRLAPDRLPARVVAPLRFLIDPAYQLAQPPETQLLLRQQGDRLQSSGLVQPLRAMQAALTREELPLAFRHAEGLVPLLSREAPGLVPRLASCLYWAIIHFGEFADISRYRRLFGTPPGEPDFSRLDALAHEQMGHMQEAHEHWQRFEQSVAANPGAWPAGQVNRVRALIWTRMGHNAASIPDLDRLSQLPAFLRDHPDRPKPLEPSAEKCFQRSLELAPDQLEAHKELVDYYLKGDKKAKAIDAARELLQHFPEHVPALEILGGLMIEAGQTEAAVDLLGRALKVNPLDRGLRKKMGSAKQVLAAAQAELGRFADARDAYQAALTLTDQLEQHSILCRWAACEFKAGDSARADELLALAKTRGGTRLARAFLLVVESRRLNLGRPLKKRFDQEFKDALAEPVSARSAVQAAEIMTSLVMLPVKYHGQKTHEKKITQYLEKCVRVEFTGAELEQLCTSLLNLDSLKLARNFVSLGRKRFPHDPFFPYFQAECRLATGPASFRPWELMPLLEEARRLASDCPQDQRCKALLELIQDRQQMIRAFGSLGNGLFGAMLDGFDDDYDEEDRW